MTKTSLCELERLGEDADTHEQIKQRIDEAFKMNCASGCATNALMNTRDLLQELIRVRNLHGLPNDGKCYNCPGDRCIAVGGKQ